MARAVITQAILKTLKSAFKKSVGKENYNQPAFGKYLYGKNYESSFRSDGSQKLKERIRNLMKQENIPALTMKQTGKLRKKTEHTEATKQKLKEVHLKNLEEARKLPLNKIKNPVLKQIIAAERRPTRVGPLTVDSELVKGVEGPIKGALGPLRKDIALLKGITSLFRSDIGYKGPFAKGSLLQPANMKKYINTASKHRAQLDDTERQIRYWLSEGDKTDVKTLRKLLTDYAELKPKSNPKYWHERAMTFGHPAAIGANIENYFRKGIGSKLSKELSKNPKYLTKMDPEIGPLNIGKDPIDRNILKFMDDPSVNVTQKGLSEISKLYEKAGIRSILPSLTGKKMYLGKSNPEKQLEFLRRSVDQGISNPFAGLSKREIRNILTQLKSIEDLGYKKGGMIENYATGGLASMIGKKALKKIAKKLSEKDLKLLMGSFFKDTKPLMSPKNLREARIKKYLAGKGATKKWQYVKSEVPGPKSSLERAQERAFYENTIVYPEAKKSFPYLDPENNAFIVAGESAHPVTGTKQLDKFGRYQLRHSVDPKDTSPISKYSVYDWWDELTQSIRKEPKFKYVKDDKGNTIMKRVK